MDYVWNFDLSQNFKIKIALNLNFVSMWFELGDEDIQKPESFQIDKSNDFSFIDRKLIFLFFFANWILLKKLNPKQDKAQHKTSKKKAWTTAQHKTSKKNAWTTAQFYINSLDSKSKRGKPKRR